MCGFYSAWRVWVVTQLFANSQSIIRRRPQVMMLWSRVGTEAFRGGPVHDSAMTTTGVCFACERKDGKHLERLFLGCLGHQPQECNVKQTMHLGIRACSVVLGEEVLAVRYKQFDELLQTHCIHC